MNWLVFHIVSGQAFFSGVGLLVISALASTRSTPLTKHITGLAFPIGVIAIVISSTAIPYWYYGLALVVTLVWITYSSFAGWRRWSVCAMVAAWGIAAFIELPRHITPKLDPAPTRSIAIIGDSVTAGAGDDDPTERWPSLLAQQRALEVHDMAHVGETVASALKRVEGQQLTSSVTFLEIGGNDLLGSTSSVRFARGLDALLAHVSAANRQVMMFELPLPPFRHEYRRMQRALADKYGVCLVPKRVFLSILAEDGSTLDTIHLSQAGHHRMAACVWQLVSSAFSPNDVEK